MPRTFTVAVAERTFTVHVTLTAGGAHVVVDGAQHPIDLERLGNGWFWFDGTNPVHAHAARVGAAPVGVEVSVALRGVELRALVRDPRTTAVTAGVARPSMGPVRLRAPMPGRIIKCLVKPGDVVTQAQAVMVVEAMKMENEVRAPRAGVVQVVLTAEGAAVESGAELLVIA